jgi:DNA-binding response OmpR family regulator
MHSETAPVPAPVLPSVLVVDDEPQVEALNEIAQHRPNLMVLDIMMPTMDGWSVLEEMLKLPDDERPRVVIVSALSSLRDRAKASELGAVAYVPKPFNVEDLLEVLHGLEEAS